MRDSMFIRQNIISCAEAHARGWPHKFRVSSMDGPLWRSRPFASEYIITLILDLECIIGEYSLRNRERRGSLMKREAESWRSVCECVWVYANRTI